MLPKAGGEEWDVKPPADGEKKKRRGGEAPAAPRGGGLPGDRREAFDSRDQ